MMNYSKPELIDMFIKNAQAVVATVEKISADADSLNAALIKATSEDEYVLFAQPSDIDPKFFSKFMINPKVITEPTKEQISTITTGITDSLCGVASTGSVCVSIMNNMTVPYSMITRRHIAVVDANNIIPRPSDVFSEGYLNGKGLKRSITYITGPSATADMGPLVRGVHGPGKLHIIIMD